MTCSDFLSRRAVLLAALAAPLSSCESESGIDFNVMKNAVGGSLGLVSPPMISLDQAAAVPYSSIGYRLDDSAEQMLILTAQIHGELLWTSSARRALSTRNGRIVECAGFPWNLGGTNFRSTDPVMIGLQGNLPRNEFIYSCDFPDISRYSVTIRSQFEKTGPETVRILNQPLATVVVTEQRTCEELDWISQNKYWVDTDTGFVWRSEQSVHPNLSPFEVEVFRPPA